MMNDCCRAVLDVLAAGHWDGETEEVYTGKTILIVDKDTVQRDRLTTSFRMRGHRVVATDRYDRVPAELDASSFDLVIMEAVLGDTDALAMIEKVRNLAPGLPIVVLTTFASVSMAVRYMRAGAALFAVKPRTADEILVDLECADHGQQPVEHPSYHRAVWEYLQQCLSSAGSLSEASRRLKLERRSLRRMLQKTPPAR